MSKEQALAAWKKRLAELINEQIQNWSESDEWLSLDCLWPDGLEDRMADAAVNTLRTAQEAYEFVQENP